LQPLVTPQTHEDPLFLDIKSDDSMFIDKAKIHVKSGNGGNGCVSFRREAHVPRGGPDGGDGGDGGDVIFEVDENMNTLLDLHYKSHVKAKNGEHGRGKNQKGKDGNDQIVRVPPGTIVKDVKTDEIIADFTGDVTRVVVAKGGRGGYGNARFANPSNQAPRHAQPGKDGEERELELELKMIADVGLVGFPNAGKSTLISKMSAAKPKIADYPFTTLTPNLGMVRVDEIHSFVVADIPGLIEGAHDGKGLGLEFLRHIQRTTVLVYLLDITLKDFWEEYQILKNELECYDNDLLKKPYLIAFNKIDMLDEEPDLDERWSDEADKCYFISALTGNGVNKLKYAINNILKEVRREEKNE
jgi:GTP-binding protein